MQITYKDLYLESAFRLCLFNGGVYALTQRNDDIHLNFDGPTLVLFDRTRLSGRGQTGDTMISGRGLYLHTGAI